MNIYGSIGSPYVARVEMMAKAMGLPLSRSELPGGMKSPEHLAMNPWGKIPCLRDGSTDLFESEVINEYLAEKHPDKAPKLSADQRAKARVLARAVDLYLAPTVGQLVGQMNPATRDAATVAKIMESIDTTLARIEALLDGGARAVAGTTTQADCALAPTLNMYAMLAAAFGNTDPWAKTPKIAALMQALANDAALGPILSESTTVLKGFFASRA